MGARLARRGGGACRSVRRRIVLFAALAACVALAVGALAACGKPGLSEEERSFYETVAADERQYIYDCQTPEGSLLDVPDAGTEGHINSYEANLTIASLLDADSSQKDLICARHYLEWYGSQMLEGRSIGLPDGVVPDFDVILQGDYMRKMTPVEPRNWDFNAASYLIALGAYASSGGDGDFVADRYDEAHRALQALLDLQGEDGLTDVKATTPVHYLVNNIESLAALDVTVHLYDTSWIPDAEDDQRAARERERDQVAEAAENCRKGIVEHLWDEGTSTWYMGIDADGEPIVPSGDDGKFLQAVAQIYPIIFGDEEASEEAGTPAAEYEEILRDSQTHYDDFCKLYQWQDLAPDTYVDDHWWPSIAFAAARMGDYDRAHTFIENYIATEDATDHGKAHSLIEAGWTARTATYLLAQS